MEDVFSYINAMNASFLDELYQKYVQDPNAVDSSWRGFFAGIDFAKGSLEKGQDVRIFLLIDAYRKHGHKKVLCNPLQETKVDVPELELVSFGLTEQDFSLDVPTFGLFPDKTTRLENLINLLEEIYCKGIGFEIYGISKELDEWAHVNVEKEQKELSKEDLLLILEDITRAELFEVFIHTKYPGQTRFSLEGGETLIPILRFILEFGAEEGLEEVIVGMAHRGRLNVLTSILGKSYKEIFEEFEDVISSDTSGDVKYHKGAHTTLQTRSHKPMNVILASNPSHLESVNPVVEGQTRAKQELKGSFNTTASLLIHGDASLAGQGVIYETLQMSKLEGYQTGGTIHLVLNNHIGYTTLPQDGRSTLYCTDIAKTFGAPVLHVNAERPVECVKAAFLAVQIRQRFGIDVFIDLNCYRKYGHNEGDEPSFTQPLEYQKIREKYSIRKILEKILLDEKAISQEEIVEKEKQFNLKLNRYLQEAMIKERPYEESLLPQRALSSKVPVISIQELQDIAKTLSATPNDFALHPKLQKLQQARLAMVKNPQEKKIDWGMGEQLAFASLLQNGIHIRLSGQDVRRGTFSHRHALFIDQKNGKKYIPLKNLGNFSLHDSPLSEFGVMGFDFGYSLSYPQSLVLWEAQYGDFYNGAQVIVDQYLSTAEKKWMHYSNMTLLLPHGYEGKGPEHSSARIERFLQLCAEDNLIIANCTTPSQFFHLLRRQAFLEIKRPLVIFTPKVLLRHPSCLSTLEEFVDKKFQECLEEEDLNTKTVVLCSGKIFYDLIQEKERRKAHFAIIRLEQLYPFPKQALEKILQKYSQVKDFIWVQEEPENMGPWQYMFMQWQSLKEYSTLRYIGRKSSASPATGSYTVHKRQYDQLMEALFKDL